MKKEWEIFRKRMDDGLTKCHAFPVGALTDESVKNRYPEHGMSTAFTVPEFPGLMELHIEQDEKYVAGKAWFER